MKTTKLTLSAVSKFIGIIGLSLFVMSCGKSGSDANHNNNVYNNGYGAALPGGQTFYHSISTDITYGMTVDLNFIGQVGYNQGYSPIVSYSGPVAVHGTLQVNQPVTQIYGGCYLPAGTYTLQTLQPGQWSQAIASNLVMTAQGPVTAVVTIPHGQVPAKTQLGATWNEIAPQGGFFADFNIQSVNGLQCAISTLIK
ncbi:MAG: hypothetical protein H7Z71_09385 [Moraxellaceae bacterium]|nr:hypothetical protein [Pseudobdellovibrionaceae bacterium]